MKKNNVTVMTYTPFNPELALRHLYLIDLLEAKVMLGIAKGMAGYICAVNSEDEVAEFLQMVYEEDYQAAYGFIEGMYFVMNEAMPDHVQALYSCYPIWKVFMNLVYDALTEYEAGLASPTAIAMVEALISKALPAELWERVQDDSVYDR